MVTLAEFDVGQRGCAGSSAPGWAIADRISSTAGGRTLALEDLPLLGGFSKNAFIPWVMALRVVSLPRDRGAG